MHGLNRGRSRGLSYEQFVAGPKMEFVILLWYNAGMVNKIERWRLEELSLLLDQLASVLRQGFNPEWASVFSHFGEESRTLLAINPIDTTKLGRLVKNIQACFLSPSSFPSLRLKPEISSQENFLTLEFLKVKARLCLALEEMDARLIKYVH